MNYLNENDPVAAQWLRNLIDAGQIAPALVDERSIEDVRPDDLAGFTQCHFFAGIGGWPLALRLAGWPDDRPVWTGSCPCQPFSAAGQGGGFADERHLWPAWHWLIEQRRPANLFGEQVVRRAGFEWFALVRADLEGSGYSVAAADLCAASVGAPHIRQRLFFVADTCDARLSTREREAVFGAGRRQEGRAVEQCGSASVGGAAWSDADWLPCWDGKFRPVEPGTFPLASRVPGRVGRLRGYGNAIVPQVAAAMTGAYMGARA